MIPYKCFCVKCYIFYGCCCCSVNTVTCNEQSDHLCCVFLQLNETALHLAADGGHYNVVTFLCNQGAVVDKIDNVSS